jgi:hypothetical protein
MCNGSYVLCGEDSEKKFFRNIFVASVTIKISTPLREGAWVYFSVSINSLTSTSKIKAILSRVSVVTILYGSR